MAILRSTLVIGAIVNCPELTFNTGLHYPVWTLFHRGPVRDAGDKGVPLEELGEIFGDDPETLAMLRAVDRDSAVPQQQSPSISDVKEHDEGKS